MHASSFLPLAFATFSVAYAAPAPPSTGPVPVFHVTQFQTLCTESNVSNECTTTFDVAYNGFEPLECSIKSTASDYVLCGTYNPEQSISAYIQESAVEPGQIIHTLKLEFESYFAGGSRDDTYGEKLLNQPEQSFDVIASSESSPKSG